MSRTTHDSTQYSSNNRASIFELNQAIVVSAQRAARLKESSSPRRDVALLVAASVAALAVDRGDQTELLPHSEVSILEHAHRDRDVLEAVSGVVWHVGETGTCGSHEASKRIRWDIGRRKRRGSVRA
jgi:hypothetical protein